MKRTPLIISGLLLMCFGVMAAPFVTTLLNILGAGRFETVGSSAQAEHPHFEYRVFSYLLPVQNNEADQVLTDLLNDGWQVDTATAINHSQVRVVYVLRRPFNGSKADEPDESLVPDA